MFGLQSSSSFKMLKQTVPDGYTFGWNKTLSNLHLGGFEGYSSEKSINNVYVAPSHIPGFPGIPHSHRMKFIEPSQLTVGRA